MAFPRDLTLGAPHTAHTAHTLPTLPTPTPPAHLRSLSCTSSCRAELPLSECHSSNDFPWLSTRNHKKIRECQLILPSSLGFLCDCRESSYKWKSCQLQPIIHRALVKKSSTSTREGCQSYAGTPAPAGHGEGTGKHLEDFPGWTKSWTTLKPWEAIVCWYLQGNHHQPLARTSMAPL